MSDESQISATDSAATRDRLEKNDVEEQALLAHRELPDEALIPTRIVLDDATFDRLAEVLERPPSPTRALRELMRSRRR